MADTLMIHPFILALTVIANLVCMIFLIMIRTERRRFLRNESLDYGIENPELSRLKIITYDRIAPTIVIICNLLLMLSCAIILIDGGPISSAEFDLQYVIVNAMVILIFIIAPWGGAIETGDVLILSEDGIRRRSVLLRQKRIAWEDITTVSIIRLEYGWQMSITSKEGEVIDFPNLLKNLDQLYRMLLERVPAEKLLGDSERFMREALKSHNSQATLIS